MCICADEWYKVVFQSSSLLYVGKKAQYRLVLCVPVLINIMLSR